MFENWLSALDTVPVLSWLGEWSELITIVYFFTILFTVVIVVLDKKSPQTATLWITVLVLLPIVGLVLYMFLGRNFRRRPHLGRKEMINLAYVDSRIAPYVAPLGDERKIPLLVERKVHVARLLVNNNRSPVFLGNDVTTYHHGCDAFPALLEDIRSAKWYVHMEYYFIEEDKIGNTVADALIECAARGVEVRLIYDDVGSFALSRRYIRRLRRAGIQVYPFEKVRFPLLAMRINYRNHRKITVVDGAIGHMGGMNIADKYIEGDPELGPWRDTQIRIVGPAVTALHGVFLSDWKFVTKRETLDMYGYMPKAMPFCRANYPIQIAASGPDSDWESIMQAFFLAISRAKRYIYIATPYFIPNESILTALRAATLSGVDVEILLPYKSDVKAVLWATRSYVGSLLDAGISVYFFKAGFNHSKIMMVDGELAAVGSANMDIRSFEDHFEVAAFIYDESVTRELELQFLLDVQGSHRVTQEEWTNRRFIDRFKYSVARLFSPLF